MLTNEKINDLRRRVLNNEPLDEAEYAEAVRQMVSERISQIVSPAPKATRKATTKPIANLDALLPK